MITIEHKIAALTAQLREARRNAPPNALCHRFGPPIILEAEQHAPSSRRKRNPNITTLIKRARKAGERGPVRVELVNDDGTRAIVTSSREAAPETMTEAEAEKLWHDRITKNAAH
jgi:hypothetical protein